MPTKLLRCGVASPEELVLTPLDLNAGFTPTKKFLVFPGSLDNQRFEKAFSDTLALFPTHAGRALKRGPDWVIRRCDSGAHYETEHRPDELACRQPLPQLEDNRIFFPKFPLQPNGPEQPLFGIKVTHFRNHVVVGVTGSHVLGDGAASWLFLHTLANLYSGEPIPMQPDHDRARFYQSALAIAAQQPRPFHIPSMSKLGKIAFVAKCLYGNLAARNISYEIKYADLPRYGTADVEITTQDQIMAMVARDVAAASNHAQLTVGSVFSVRRFPELGIDESYVGNAICARITVRDRGDWIADGLGSAHALRRTLNALTTEEVASEFELFRLQHERASLSSLLPDFISSLFSGGILLNNCTRFPMYTCALDGVPPLWAFTRHPGLPRYASIFPNRGNDGVVVNLKMPRREIARLLALSPAQRSFRDYVFS